MNDQYRKLDEDDQDKGEMTVSEAGKMDGEEVKEQYGPGFYEEIGEEGEQKAKRLGEEGKEATGEDQENE